jgi:nicotinate-nucleotide--dimethylbenzimidazole phosphoribosyltransferase
MEKERHVNDQAGQRFAAAVQAVEAVDPAVVSAAAAHHDRLTKPPGSLGRVEVTGVRLAAIAGEVPPPIPEPAAVAVFAADHGVHAAGVTSWPREVTAQMVANFCNAGAAINVIAGRVGASVHIVDVGVATAIPGTATAVLDRKIALGTRDLSIEPAMDRDQALVALDVGCEIAARLVDDGNRCLLTGDMGIANTTASAAVIGAITGRMAADVTGRGAGADDDTLARKVEVIERATTRVDPDADAIEILRQVGGFEIAALAGFIVGGAAARTPVIVDGVIALAGLLIASSLAPDVVDYVIAGHRSVEPGATAALAHLGLEPVLDLDLRLGEGTGAALALPVVQAAAAILSDMATFDDARVNTTPVL